MAPRVSIGTPGMAADRKVELDHRVGRGERGVDVAVAVVHDEGRGVAGIVEFAGRIARRQKRRQRCDLDLDEVRRVLGDIRVLGEHGGDGVADIAHAVDRQHRLAIGLDLVGRARGVAEIDRGNAGDVGAGPHGGNARRGRSACGGVDAHDPAVRDGGAHHAHVELMGKGDIAGEPAVPPHERRVLDPRHRMAEHAALVRARRRRIALAHVVPAALRISAAAARTALMMFW